MRVFSRSIELQNYLNVKKKSGKIIGFVPTMGALHNGHLALVNCAKQNNDLTCVSIFINPSQFNNEQDLINYPRKEKEDTEMLKMVDCDLLFLPDRNEMYPEEDTRIFDFDGLDKEMEGKFRHGHFNGVAQIVSKLFSIVKPHNVYFGQKDFQQLAIIKYLNENYLKQLNINVVACKTVREPDGLAMSSRNLLLSVEQRSSAALISKTLQFLKENHSRYSIIELKKIFKDTIDKDLYLKTEYIEIVDNDRLKPVDKITLGKTTACVAVHCGSVRLIDNISFE